MTTNLSRFEKDLERLISTGELLQISMARYINKTSIDKRLEKSIGKTKAAEFIKKLPDFNTQYEAWYSESLAMLKQMLPDRVANYVSQYEKPKNRKQIDFGNYVIQDYLQTLRVRFGADFKVDPSAAVPQFNQQLAIVKAAKQRFQTSLFDIRKLVQADLFDSEIDAAKELQRHRFHRAAGVLAGVVLEKHLHQICADRSIRIAKKSPSLNDLGELLRTSNVIDVPLWRHLSFLSDIRNICAHSKHKEPTEAQIDDLLVGVEKFVKTVS